MSLLRQQADTRRTFAIISHPDAGKTTITEKLLLYAGAIHLAGSVKSRRASRHALSDWMQMEQERGISITTSVLQFDYAGCVCNLLDTPGHADFSEDTYRTLAAVDSAVMLIDHAKGVEARTRKLFEVCRLRKMPVVTFMNKLDRAGLEPLALIDEVAHTLGLRVAPINWPIGMGRDFVGVVEIATRLVTLFETGEDHGASVLKSETLPLEQARTRISASLYNKLCEELELLAAAGDAYDHEAFLAGEVSPVFWGSAMSNFGVQPLLEFLAQRASRPTGRTTTDARTIVPHDERFTGFIFKLQANMNPRHRDRIAFMRVVSGRFEKGMEVVLGRTGEAMRLTKPHSFVAQERAHLEEAWPGDIVGLYDSGKLRVGDTLAAGNDARTAVCFDGIPRFAPEHFGQLTLADPLRRKALDAGLLQLAQEGIVQLFFRDQPSVNKEPYLGAVGLLQFEVLKERLKHEYRVNATFRALSYRLARWVGGSPQGLAWLQERHDYHLTRDRNGRPVVLSDSPWPLDYALRNAPGLELHEIEPN